jgi:hypothetical protein
MTICVKEPESGEELQLAVKLLDIVHRSEWLVTMPKGNLLLFQFSDRGWTVNHDEKINDELIKAISRVISLLSIHQQAGKDLDKFFREPKIGPGKL